MRTLLRALLVTILVSSLNFAPCQSSDSESECSPPTKKARTTAGIDLTAAGIGLQGLPPEILIANICPHLEVPDLSALARTSKLLRAISYSAPMWGTLLKRCNCTPLDEPPSPRHQFFHLVASHHPSALLVWADFFMNREFIDPDYDRPHSSSKCNTI